MINYKSKIRKKQSGRPIRLILLFQITSILLVLIYNIGKFDYKMFFASISLIFLTLLSNILISKMSNGDNYILFIANMLFSIGIIMIMRIEFSLGIRQLKLYILSIIGFFLVYLFLKKSMVYWKDKTYFYFFLCLFMFLFTLVFAKFTNGARNWISIFGKSLQLSEFTKIVLVMLIASFYYNYDKFSKMFLGKYYLTIAMYIFIGFFFLQRELGTAVVFFSVLLSSQIIFEKDIKLIIFNLLFAIFGMIIAYFLFSHIRLRVEIWLDPWSSINDKGYQIVQSLFAISNGGLTGSGIGLGNPNFIPLGYSDFIFASICEEMGIFMGICLVLLFLILFYRGMKIAMSKDDIFYSALASSIAILFSSQALIMFMGVLKIIPLTGITIPFVSHGGSSLLSSYILLAMLQIASEDTLELEGAYEKK